MTPQLDADAHPASAIFPPKFAWIRQLPKKSTHAPDTKEEAEVTSWTPETSGPILVPVIRWIGCEPDGPAQ